MCISTYIGIVIFETDIRSHMYLQVTNIFLQINTKVN